MSAIPDIRIADSIDEWANNTAAFIALLSERAIRSKGRFTMALSGGSTPKTLYQVLASPEWSTRLDWTKVYFLFGDERCVPPDHPDSNFRMAQAELFQPLNIQTDRIFRMKGECPDRAIAARDYDATIRTLAHGPVPTLPTLDLVLLGLGEDGHTASLFPGTTALHVRDTLVTVGQAPSGTRDRLTLTFGALNHATVVLFLVAGASKADMVRRVLEPRSEADRSLPSALVSPESGCLVWMLDQSAAAQLTRT
jgi:6-phosphogluconolactonase